MICGQMRGAYWKRLQATMQSDQPGTEHDYSSLLENIRSNILLHGGYTDVSLSQPRPGEGGKGDNQNSAANRQGRVAHLSVSCLAAVQENPGF